MSLRTLGTVAGLVLSITASAQDQNALVAKYRPYVKGVGVGNYVLGPTYSDAPELKKRDDVPHGRVVKFVMDSAESTLYPGIAKNQAGVVPYKRRVTVYVPSQYVAGKEAPFLISQDSMGAGELPTILDNMIADKRLPAMVAIMIDSGGGDAQGSQRGLEYDTLSGMYAEFVEREVLPRVAKEAGIQLSKDPNARMTMGGSSGGAAAFSMAWYHPDLYRRVLAYSGTFVNQQWPVSKETPRGAWEYHQTLIPNAKRKPLRVWLQVGEKDFIFNRETPNLHHWPLANIYMADALAAKRYPYQFVYCRDAGHVDWKAVRQTLPQALEWVWQGYRSKG